MICISWWAIVLDHLFNYNDYDYNEAWTDDGRYACLVVELILLWNLIVFLLILLQSTGIVDKEYLPYHSRILMPFLASFQHGGGMKHDLHIKSVNHSKASIFNSNETRKDLSVWNESIVPTYIWISSKYVFKYTQ